MQPGRVLRRDLTMRLCLRAARSHSPGRYNWPGSDSNRRAFVTRAQLVVYRWRSRLFAIRQKFLRDPGKKPFGLGTYAIGDADPCMFLKI